MTSSFRHQEQPERCLVREQETFGSMRLMERMLLVDFLKDLLVGHFGNVVLIHVDVDVAYM